MRTVARDAAIVLAISLALLTAIELSLRQFFPQQLEGTGLRGEHLSVADTLVGIRYVPGAVWRFRHPEYTVEYAINSRGLRDTKEHSLPKPPGTFRILLLGDSFTFGQGVNYEDAWPAIAERSLAAGGLRQVDLIKAGRQGMDTRSELILLPQLAAEYQPDAVVVGFLINDLYTNVPYDRRQLAAWDTVRNQVFRQADERRGLQLSILARRLLIATDVAYVRLYLAAPGRGEYLRVPPSAEAERQLAITQTLFRQLAAACDSLRLPLAVFSIPQQFQVLYQEGGRQEDGVDVGYYDTVLGGVAEAEGFDWVPTLKAFGGAGNGHSLFHRLDGHLTPAGNAIVADVFVEDVVPRLLSRVQEKAIGRVPGVAGRRDSSAPAAP